jgi:hypothetical protein
LVDLNAKTGKGSADGGVGKGGGVSLLDPGGTFAILAPILPTAFVSLVDENDPSDVTT